MLRKIHVLALAAGLFVGWSGTAKAGNLDTKLNEEMPKVVKYLKDKGYKNVGILPFRTQKAASKVGFNDAPINTTMVERVERMLVIHGGTDKAPLFGITRDAGHTAQQAKVGRWFKSETERKRLFDIQYPLSWGESKVKVDAFVTGKVVNSADLKKTTVTLEAFSKVSPTLVKVCEFTVNTDRGLVRDLGYNFSLTKQQRVQLVRARDEEKEQKLDDLTLTQAKQGQQAAQQDKPQSTEKPALQQGVATPDNVAGIEVKMMVGKEAQAITKDGTSDAKWETRCPPKGTPVFFTLKNTDKEQKRAVVLKVAGKNTVDQQTEDADKCRKWVLNPGETFSIRGYYMGEKAEKFVPFVVMDGEDARRAIEELGEKSQFIQIDVFTDEEIPQDPKRVTPRSLKPEVAKLARQSYSSWRSKLKTAYGLSLVRGRDGEMVLGPDPKALEGVGIKESEVVDFKVNPTPIGSLTIKVTATPAQPQPKPQPEPEPELDETP